MGLAVVMGIKVAKQLDTVQKNALTSCSVAIDFLII